MEGIRFSPSIFFRVIFQCTPPQVQLSFLYFLTQTVVYFVQFMVSFFYSLHTYLINSPLEMQILGCYNECKKKRFSISFSFSYLSFRGHPGIVWSTIPGLSMSGGRTANSCQGLLLIVTSHPVAVPDILLGIEMPSSTVDRCHSLSSLFLPPAALASLPAR